MTNPDFNLYTGRVKVPMSCGLTGDFVLGIAQERGHPVAQRLATIQVRNKSALSEDSNVLYRACWYMCGGDSPVTDAEASVDPHEVEVLLESAREKWQNPKPIPRWCCNGVHSAGDDRRFAGLWPEMWAVCQAREF